MPCKDVQMHIHLNVYIYIPVHTHLSACANVDMDTDLDVDVDLDLGSSKNIRIHIHIYIYIYICIRHRKRHTCPTNRGFKIRYVDVCRLSLCSDVSAEAAERPAAAGRGVPWAASKPGSGGSLLLRPSARVTPPMPKPTWVLGGS